MYSVLVQGRRLFPNGNGLVRKRWPNLMITRFNVDWHILMLGQARTKVSVHAAEIERPKQSFQRLVAPWVALSQKRHFGFSDQSGTKCTLADPFVGEIKTNIFSWLTYNHITRKTMSIINNVQLHYLIDLNTYTVFKYKYKSYLKTFVRNVKWKRIIILINSLLYKYSLIIKSLWIGVSK